MARTKSEINPDAIAGLRRDAMMAYLLDALDQGTDIGHYGRFVFATIARHFLNEEELITLLARDDDFDADAARRLVHDVQERDYSPPRREKILDFQSRQEFPIIPDTDDPDMGNVYRDLTFPDPVYQHISEYREEKEQAHA